MFRSIVFGSPIKVDKILFSILPFIVRFSSINDKNNKSFDMKITFECTFKLIM